MNGIQLKERRKVLGMTQQDLAVALSVSISAVSNWEQAAEREIALSGMLDLSLRWIEHENTPVLKYEAAEPKSEPFIMTPVDLSEYTQSEPVDTSDDAFDAEYASTFGIETEPVIEDTKSEDTKSLTEALADAKKRRRKV